MMPSILIRGLKKLRLIDINQLLAITRNLSIDRFRGRIKNGRLGESKKRQKRCKIMLDTF